MILVRLLRRIAAAGTFVLLLIALPVEADTPASKAEAFVKNLADVAIRDLTDVSLAQSEQESRFRRIIEQNIAVKSIARWVMGGRTWRRATEEQRDEYLSLFTDLMVATYAHRFQSYSGETLSVESAQEIDANQTLVRTTIRRPNADRDLKIDWRVRETQGQLRVIDVMVEGLSMAQTQRSEFASFLRANGNSVEALNSELERRLTNVRNGRVTEAARNP